MGQREKVGPTGKFPKGKLTPHDEGELTLSIGVVRKTIVMDFGTSVAWIGFSADEAIAIAEKLVNAAKMVEKIT